ncbi:hypothetical protein OQA88_4069 [Cercophora sp. LCS_1]
MARSDFLRQIRALTKKNLLLLVTRHWLGTLLQAIVAPVLIYALLLNIRNYSPTSNRYGIGEAAPVRSIRDSISGNQQLVFVRPEQSGSDVERVIQAVSATLPPERVVVFSDRQQASDQCIPNYRKVSRCYAIVSFIDSPLTLHLNQTWNYTLQFDPSRNGWFPNVHTKTNDIQLFQMPVQLAIDNAITNSSEVPDEFQYTFDDQEGIDLMVRATFNQALVTTYVIVFFLGTLPGVYHAVSFVTGERADGISQLIDAMGGSPAARVVSSILALSACQSIGWVVAGVLYHHFLFYDSNAAILVFWQIWTGLAFLTASVFGASFFHRRRISSVFVLVCVCCLGGGAAVLLNKDVNLPKVVFLSILFPSMNYIFALTQMGRFAMVSEPIDMTASKAPFSELAQVLGDELPVEKYYVPVLAFWAMLILHIIVYPLLTILAEKRIHGLNFKARTLSETVSEEPDTPDAAIRIVGLTKVYPTKWFQRIFGRGDTNGFRALDSLDLVAQKNQILCLLGVNGAGKSTTLDLLSGFHVPTSGDMFINTRPSRLGVCPQKNVLFNRLTVLEHVQFWSQLKGGDENLEGLHALIAACDLTAKTDCQARTLSGGQKRKLQLACMFVGGATVCLMDEVTTGLDPISRRTIWDIVLERRKSVSMVFTTHFLDEGEVLADHIVILSKGQIKCQGSGAELKNRFGGGYRVYLPKDADIKGLDLPKSTHQDQIVYRTPDSTSAAELVARIESAGSSEVRIAGPTVEDVFLRVAQDDVDAARKTTPSESEDERATPTPVAGTLTSGRRTTFFQQVSILMMKRLRILPRYWAGAFLALALPIATMPPINVFIADDFERPDCRGITNRYEFTQDLQLRSTISSPYYKYERSMPFGPSSRAEELFNVLVNSPIAETGYNSSNFDADWEPQPDFDSFHRYIRENHHLAYGGVYVGDKPTIAHQAGNTEQALISLRVYTLMRSGVSIASALTTTYGSFSDVIDASWTYILYAAFIFTVYPAFFALYPAFERTSQVRALQCSNGVRPLPMWAAYFFFDFCFVLVISIAYTVTISVQFPFWWGSSYMFAIVLLHGMTSILVGYIVSSRAASQLSAFLWTLGISAVAYFGLALSYTLPSILSDPLDIQRNTDIVSYVLDLIFPIGNVFRGMAVGLNLYRLACRGDSTELSAPGSWWGYGFPITYLIIQVIALAALLVWLDSDLNFSMLKPRGRTEPHPEEVAVSLATATGVDKEAVRVETAQADDLLRMAHVSKAFNTNVAVDDVSLGLGQNEILALLGPNGAGKTTIVNLMRGELKPDSGRILLRDEDVTGHSRKLTQSIGVCPQFDALDLLTARQHLEFYARIKGVQGRAEVRANAEIAMARVGLTPFANTQASKLSGGNKRKLSLAIALMGDPAVLILDEPSSAMDAAAKRNMWKVLAEEVAPGRSVLLTTHSMEEADALATRAAILSRRLLAIGTTQVLRQRYSNLYHVELVLATAPHSTEGEMRAVEGWVKEKFPDARFEGANIGGQIKFMVPVAGVAVAAPAEGNGDLTIRAEGKGRGGGVGHVIAQLEKFKRELGIQDYSIGAPTLERVFLSVVKNNFTEEEETKRPTWRRFLGLA